MVFDLRDRAIPVQFRCTTPRFFLCCAIVALFSLWLRSGLPVFALADAGEDDALFVRLAQALAAGHWLGAFDKLTLVKGMAYPLFIAASFWIGLPLKLAEQGLHLAACFLTAALVRRHVSRQSWAPASIFLVLALDPMLWTAELARVIREGLYISLSLALLTLSAWVSFTPPEGRRPLPALGLGCLLGLVAGAFWLTREEGLWLAPAVAVNLGLGGFAGWRARRRGPRGVSRSDGVRSAPFVPALPWAAAAVTVCASVFGVAWINDLHYGAFETTEVQSLAFRRAYGALARIGQEHPRRYIVFPKDARDAAYAVSPAARELAPVLDGPAGDDRRRAGCAEAEVTDCPEILAGWFQWALRDAAAAAGHYGSARDAGAYYVRLADEIDSACARGALRCLLPRATLAPPFRWEDADAAVRTLPRLAWILLSMGNGTVGTLPSVGAPSALAAMADSVGPIAPALAIPKTIRGWAAAAAPPALRVGFGSAGVTTEPAPDVARAFPTLKPIRFTLDTAGSTADGALLVETGGQGEVALPLKSLLSGATLDAGGATVHIDDGVQTFAPVTGESRRRLIVTVARRIADLYARVMPAACALACFGLIAAWVWRRHSAASPALVALCLSSATAVLCRLALLAYLDATAIPSVNTLYPSPAAPLLLLFASLGCWLGAGATLGRVRRWSAAAGQEDDRRSV